MTTDKGNPLEECCPGCENLGTIRKRIGVMQFKIAGKMVDIEHVKYRCDFCGIEFLTTEPKCDPFQKAKDLGWVKG
jgi:hypothetical protein